MKKYRFEELVNNSFDGIENEYLKTQNKVGCYINGHGFNIYTNDSEGILSFHYTTKSIETAYDILANKLGLFIQIDTKELDDDSKKDLSYILRLLYHTEPNISNNSLALKSWIKLVTLNQIKIMSGKNLMKNIDNIDEKNCADSRYIDSVLCAYYKNITDGLYIKNKLYKMSINEEVIKSLREIKKRKLVK